MLGWPHLLSKMLNVDCKNLAEPAADNLFIYRCYLDTRHLIKDNDYVVIGWSHPSRKTFVVDQSIPAQQEVIDKSKIYSTSSAKFMRLINSLNPDPAKWLNRLTPVSRGNSYYDQWFKNYYSDIEQATNFQSYVDSVALTCTGRYLPFYFSKESVHSIDISRVKHAGFLSEFISENNFNISNSDAHLNAKGHKVWAQQLFNLL